MALFSRKQKQPLAPSFAQLSDPEQEWVAGTLTLAREAGLDPDDLDGVSRFFDEHLSSWLELPEDDRPDPNSMINVIGVTVGQHMVQHGFAWTIVTDQFGTDLAVVRQPGNLTVVPANLVAKRWTSGEKNWLVPVVSTLRDHDGAE